MKILNDTPCSVLPLLLLSTGLVLLLRERRSYILEHEVTDLRRELSSQRVPPQPPYPLSQLDLERRNRIVDEKMSHRHDPRLAINEEKSSDSSSNLAAVQAVASFSRGTHLVGKKTFSDEQRLVFFAGIEGTGHHFWSAVFDDQAVGALATADPHEFGPAGELWQLAKQGPELCNKACDDPSSTSSALLPNRSHSPKALKEAIANLVGKLAAGKIFFGGPHTLVFIVSFND